MRPRSLEEFVGQQEIVGPGRLLRRAIEADRLHSLIFYGPPGTGKTSLAHVIAGHTGAEFVTLNAVTAGVAELRAVIDAARQRRKMSGRRTIVLIDEIHRFNRAQQDALLPAVEDGTIILIGATTENPFFAVNAPLLSRAQIFRLRPLNREEMREILSRAIRDPERGLGKLPLKVEPEAIDHWIEVAAGDARRALNALELAALTTPPQEDGLIHISLQIAEDSIQQRVLQYDRQGDNHYDTISAYIKSLRGSDPDAALHYLVRMLEAGEDPLFIARRLMIQAAEDVGNADPQALLVAVAAAQAVERLGLPEGAIPLAQATIYVACAPKSNASYLALARAREDVQKGLVGPIPAHLRDAHYPGAERLGHGKGYLYPHDFPGHFVVQQYLPDILRGRRYYHPSENGLEAEIGCRLRAWREAAAKEESGTRS
ncbi:MAG: replication-associated recombination protein A [Limnochordales bacterium]|nr:replication-associated recombination protein A [Limnochordales bacterium]